MIMPQAMIRWIMQMTKEEREYLKDLSDKEIRTLYQENMLKTGWASNLSNLFPGIKTKSNEQKEAIPTSNTAQEPRSPDA
jgi:hypothetical protein